MTVLVLQITHVIIYFKRNKIIDSLLLKLKTKTEIVKTQQLYILLIAITQLFTMSCGKEETADNNPANYRQEMRDFVINLVAYAKNHNSNFIIIPQNGQELITDNGEGNGTPQTAYLHAIDATGRESMFYGYYNDN